MTHFFIVWVLILSNGEGSRTYYTELSDCEKALKVYRGIQCFPVKVNTKGLV